MVQKIHPWGVIWVPSSTLRLVSCQKKKWQLCCPVWRCKWSRQELLTLVVLGLGLVSFLGVPEPWPEHILSVHSTNPNVQLGNAALPLVECSESRWSSAPKKLTWHKALKLLKNSMLKKKRKLWQVLVTENILMFNVKWIED